MSQALKDCCERVTWTTPTIILGIMQRLYLKQVAGSRQAVLAVPNVPSAVKELQDMKCDFKGNYSLDILHAITFDLNIDP